MVIPIRYRWQTLSLLLLAALILWKNTSSNPLFLEEQHAISLYSTSTTRTASSKNPNENVDDVLTGSIDEPQKETKRVPSTSGYASHGSNASSSSHNHSQTSQRPSLSELVENENMVGDVQFLLDFGLVGHPKTGTTRQMNWIREHEQVQMRGEEVYFLEKGRSVEMVEYLYALPEGDEYKRGYKAPGNIVSPIALEALRTYWPQTKLVVGIRHPIRWIESHYNFKMRPGGPIRPIRPMRKGGKKNILLPPEQMVGDALPNTVQMHKNLALLGKTIVSAKDKEQYELLGWDDTASPPPKMTNPIFLYDSGQPFDTNRTRAKIYAKDLSDFLGLSPPLRPIERIEAGQNRNHQYAIDICNEDFVQLRSELMEVSRNASIWIKRFFLDHKDVTVSSRDHFRDVILESWMVDPCDKPPEEEEQ